MASMVEAEAEAPEVRMGLQDFFGIRYKLHKSVCFDEYLEALDVDRNMRSRILDLRPVIELTGSNGVYKFKSISIFSSSFTKFRLGEEFDEELPDGRLVRSRYTQEGEDKLMRLMKGEKESSIIIEYSKQQVVMTCLVGDVVATRIYTVEDT